MTVRIKCKNEECPYYANGTKVIASPEGDMENAELVIVGEALGQVEVQLGRPFVGRSGKLLRQELMNTEFDMSNILFTNVCWCRPPNNETPPFEVQQACFKYYKEVWDEIEGRPRTFMTAGRTSTDFFIKGLRPRRGKVYQVEDRIFVPTYHPAYLLRNERGIFEFKEDLELIKGIAERRKDVEDIPFFVVWGAVDMNELLDDVARADIFSFDLETVGTDPYAEEAKILLISFAMKEKVWVLPVSHPRATHGLSFTTVLGNLQIIFGSEGAKVAQNGKFDIRWLKSVGVEAENFYFDTMIAQYLLNSREFEPIGLKHLTWMYFPEYGGYDYGVDLSPENILGIEFAKLCKYSAMDAWICLKISEKQELALLDEGLDVVYEKVLMEATSSLAEVERAGFKVDFDYVKQMSAVFKNREQVLNKKLRAEPSLPLDEEERKEFNFGSNKQLGELLFGKMRCPVIRLTPKGQPSVDSGVLKELARRGITFCSDLIEMRRYGKWRSTYLENYIEDAGRNVERLVRTDYNLGTSGGRLSSSNPPMQNLPKELRNCFISRFDNGLLVEGDFRQVELRVAAIYSRDENMIEMLNSGRDIHKESFARVKTVMEGRAYSPGEVTDDERQTGKGINFGFIYGRQAQSIADEFGISLEEAEVFRTSFFEMFPKILNFHDDCHRKLHDTGYGYSLLGRRRFLGTFDTDKGQRRSVNFPVQSLASDVCLHTLNKLYKKMKEEGMQAKIVATVHDSIVVDSPENEVERVVELLEGLPVEMSLFETDIPLGFPMDISVGERWGSLEKI